MSPANILLIYSGGTIGMVQGDDGYEPRRGFLAAQLATMAPFCDPTQPPLTTPPSRFGRRARYDVLELDPVLDSSNMRPGDWVRIARAIEKAYDDYDAFVVLHGTDTMAYTASALSFMLRNLSKPVVLTGSQIPLTHLRNDGVANLLGALMVAAHYEIPEVTLFFHDRLMRGNRTQKVDASGFSAFDSGNLPPLATVGVSIDVNWHLVRAPDPGPLIVTPIASPRVACFRLFPGMQADTLERLLQTRLHGVVLETYGSGNGPAADPEFLRVLREARARGIVLVNCTQCHRGSVSSTYAAGSALAEAGVISGADMTPEAALTKLSYLLSLDLTPDEIDEWIPLDLRGELTRRDAAPRFRLREE